LGNGGADALVVSFGATVNATVSAAWTATSASGNNGGIANLTSNGLKVSLAAATGTSGFSVSNASATGAGLTGSAQNDSLNGGNGNDTLMGLAGNDTLYGEAGNDSMVGGLGDDTYYLDSTGDKVVELANQGTDTVVSDISLSLAKVANVENWVGIGSADIAATGNALGNSLTGNSGSNTVDGGLGNDTLTGGAGADRFVFSSKLGVTNTDTITDFVSGTDKIQLSKSVFSKFKAGAVAQANFVSGGANTKALDSNDYLIFNGSQLLYDADGSGKGVAVVVANIVGTVVSSDLVVA
jgi:Ca2+-binding RTX toxin-like protein